MKNEYKNAFCCTELSRITDTLAKNVKCQHARTIPLPWLLSWEILLLRQGFPAFIR